MRILTVLGSAAYGGAERMAVEVSAAWVAGGVLAEGVCLNDGPMRESFEKRHVPLHGPLLKFSHDPWGMVRLARLVKERRFDRLLIADIYRNALICSTWAKRKVGGDLQCWLWCSAIPGGQGGRFTPRIRRYLQSRQLDGLICVSELQRQRLMEEGLPGDRMTVAPNGVDLAEFAAIPRPNRRLDKKPVFLQVANVMPDKDFETLLSAAAMLRDQDAPFELRLVGRGTDSREMRQHIERLGLTPVVTCLGELDDVKTELGGADCFILSSRSEVCNVAVLEAMAAGLPVITTDLPAFDNIFTQGMEGLKTPPGNPAALAEAMSKLAGDGVLRIRLAHAAQHRVEMFSLTQTAKSILKAMA